MNAVIYARFGSVNQNENSIEKQIRICEEYAKEKGYTITNRYVDIGSREQFEQMIKDSDKKQFQYVVVYQLDRFSRNIIEQVINEETLNNNEVQLVSTQENFINDPSSILLKNVIKSVQQYYSREHNRNIRERIKVTNEG